VSSSTRDARHLHGTRVLKIAVSAALLVFVFRRVDFEGVGRSLARADGVLVLIAWIVYVAGQVLSAIKWRVLASAVGLSDSAAHFVAYYFVGTFFNAFGLGTVGGDVVRALYLAGPGGRRSLALNTVVADRVSGLAVLLAIALAALLVFRGYGLPGFLYWTTVAVSLALLATWRFAPALAGTFLREGSRGRNLVERDLAPYWNDRRLLARTAALSFAFHVSQLLTLGLLASSLDLGVPWSYVWVFGPLVNIFSALPISVNGLGVRESATVFFLSHIGVAREQSVAFALLWFAIVAASGLCGGVVYLRHRRVSEN
jgi:hypothetical protein